MSVVVKIVVIIKVWCPQFATSAATELQQSCNRSATELRSCK
jgi:hypothetical protein